METLFKYKKSFIDIFGNVLVNNVFECIIGYSVTLSCCNIRRDADPEIFQKGEGEVRKLFWENADVDTNTNQSIYTRKSTNIQLFFSISSPSPALLTSSYE